MRDSMADSGLDAFGFRGQFRHDFVRCNFERAPIAQLIFIFSSITLGDSVDFRKGDCAVVFCSRGTVDQGNQLSTRAQCDFFEVGQFGLPR